MVKCCVPFCTGNGTFRIPRDEKRKISWELAIGNGFRSSASSRICTQHFKEDEVLRNQESYYSGLVHVKKFLKPNVVPSQMLNLDKCPVQGTKRNVRKRVAKAPISSKKTKIQKSKLSKKSKVHKSTLHINSTNEENIHRNEIIDSNKSDTFQPLPNRKKQNEEQSIDTVKHFTTIGTQMGSSYLSIHTFSHRDDIVHYYTGLETYVKFCFVYSTVSPYVSEINYFKQQVSCLSPEDMMFLTFMKLKTNSPDFELSLFFGISESLVSNIFQTWVYFLYQLWSLLDTWPCPEIVKNYMPQQFQHENFPIVEQHSMADCGSNIQDIFAVNSLQFIKDQQHLPGMLVLSDKKLGSEQVQIEKIINFSKSYKILQMPLNPSYRNIATEIYLICLMLCNFREGVITNK